MTILSLYSANKNSNVLYMTHNMEIKVGIVSVQIFASVDISRRSLRTFYSTRQKFLVSNSFGKLASFGSGPSAMKVNAN